jgi:hypothetical protein
MTHRIAMLEAQVIVLDIELEVRKDELSKGAQSVRVSVSLSTTPRRNERRTSSRIFFHMIRVISSPSSSTTGFFTTILSPVTHQFRGEEAKGKGKISKQST